MDPLQFIINGSLRMNQKSTQMQLKTLSLNSSVIIQNNQLNQDNKLLSFLVLFLKFQDFLHNNANLYANLHLLLPFQ